MLAAAPSSILLVEEHDEMRAALRDWLFTSLPPLRLHEARSMDEALAEAARRPVDLALVNMELPGPNGLEAARALMKRHPALPVILMSLHDSEALRLAALAAGARAFLCKRELPTGLLPELLRLLKLRI